MLVTHGPIPRAQGQQAGPRCLLCGRKMEKPGASWNDSYVPIPDVPWERMGHGWAPEKGRSNIFLLNFVLFGSVLSSDTG